MNRVPHLLLLLAFLCFQISCSRDIAVRPGPSNDRYEGATYVADSQRALVATSSATKILSGMVVGITDGDTFTILDDRDTSYVVRMKGIDAPEKLQPFSNASRGNLARLIKGKSVTIEWQKHDQYGRIVGKVSLNGDDVCLNQIDGGLAWHYKEFENEQSDIDRQLYAEAEREAQSQRRGLWEESAQIPPWDFRHHRELTTRRESRTRRESSLPRESPSRQESSLPRESPSHRESSMPRESPSHREFQAPPLEKETQKARASVEAIRGNKRSKIYHWPGCPNYDDIAPHNRVPFRSREEAERVGYRAARNCP